jgi:hypothetical protein
VQSVWRSKERQTTAVIFWVTVISGLVAQLGKEASQSTTQTITALQLFSKLRILATPTC